MRKIVKYKLLRSDSHNYLSEEVERYLKQGWELYFGPYSSIGKYMDIYIQAVVKYEE